MVRLFVADIDGCLGKPYQPFDLVGLRQVAEHVESGAASGRPAFTVCSGRPFPYVEAVAQMLGLQVPVLFESGGGQFDPVESEVTWHPAFSDAAESQLEKVSRWLQRTCLPGTSLMMDYGKHTQCGVVGPDAEEVAATARRARAFVEHEAPALQVHTTSTAVNVMPAGVTKREGLQWYAETHDLQLDEIAYIGDTEGDLQALAAVGFSFAPANAEAAVRERVQHVTEGAVVQGTLEAYRWCVQYNVECARRR